MKGRQIRPPPGTIARLFVIATLVAGCGDKSSVEQQVIAVINDMESRVEAGERGPFMDHVASEFVGQGGEMGHDQLSAFMLLQIRRYRNLEVQLLPIDVIDGGNGVADARFQVLVLGGPGLVPETGQLYQVETRWELRGDNWLLIRANWRPATQRE